MEIFTARGALTLDMQDCIHDAIDKAAIEDLLFMTGDMVERRALGACISMRLEFIINDSILKHMLMLAAQRKSKQE